jgi:hypothetical protein
MKIYKILLTVCCIIWLSGCSPEITKEAAQVRSHTTVNKLLDGCKRLGQVKVEFEAKSGLNPQENEIQMQNELKQLAYDNYMANNVVILQARFVRGAYREADMVYGRGIAYSCQK